MNRPIETLPLPYIDEHVERVEAPPEVVWAALSRELRRNFGGSVGFARLLGCDPADLAIDFDGRVGQTVPGFRVVESAPGRLVLRGRHRFANYELIFLLDRGELRAQTRAEFPGLPGRLYRAFVIASGAHRFVTRRLLRRIARAALRATPAGAQA